MANQFFESIEDESDYFWGYKFVGKLRDFVSSNDKYLDLKISSTFTFIKQEFNKLEFEAIFQQSLTEKIRIVFNECAFRWIGEVSISNASISLYNCTFLSSRLTFDNCSNLSIELAKCKRFSSFKIANSEEVNLRFEICEINSIKLNLVKSTGFYAQLLKSSTIDLVDSDFNSITLLQCKGILFNSVGYNLGEMLFREVSGSTIRISEPVTQTSFEGVWMEGFTIEEVNFEKITIIGSGGLRPTINNFSLTNTSNISITSVNINNVLMSGNSLTNISLSLSRIKLLAFIFFRIEQDVIFELVDFPEGTLTLRNASLSNLELRPSFLHQATELEVFNSTLDGVILKSFTPILPSVIRRSVASDEGRIDLCRELNSLMIQQNNKHYATVYRALELELRSRSNDFSLNWYDKVVLKLNYWSNDNGTRPQRAFFGILIMIIIMFGIINLDLAYQSCQPYETGLDFLSQNYSYFIKPFTFLSDVENSYKPFNNENMQARFHPITKGFDFLFKIFYAYLLYQFIAAFRKFNK